MINYQLGKQKQSIIKLLCHRKKQKPKKEILYETEEKQNDVVRRW